MQMREQILSLRAQWQAGLVVVEDTASGVGLLQLLQEQAGVNAIGRHSAGDKITRIAQHQSRFEAGRILLPREAPWLAEFEHELLSFPHGRYDDQVDALLLLLDWHAANERQLEPIPIVAPQIIRVRNPFEDIFGLSNRPW